MRVAVCERPFDMLGTGSGQALPQQTGEGVRDSAQTTPGFRPIRLRSGQALRRKDGGHAQVSVNGERVRSKFAGHPTVPFSPRYKGERVGARASADYMRVAVCERPFDRPLRQARDGVRANGMGAGAGGSRTAPTRNVWPSSERACTGLCQWREGKVKVCRPSNRSLLSKIQGRTGWGACFGGPHASGGLRKALRQAPSSGSGRGQGERVGCGRGRFANGPYTECLAICGKGRLRTVPAPTSGCWRTVRGGWRLRGLLCGPSARRSV